MWLRMMVILCQTEIISPNVLFVSIPAAWVDRYSRAAEKHRSLSDRIITVRQWAASFSAAAAVCWLLFPVPLVLLLL